MAVTLQLLFVIAPVYSITLRIFARKNIKEMWSLPIIAATLFLLGTWIFFALGEGAFVIYAGIYLFVA